nr:MAG TPA: hypothetical protein [Caudoviricetes sp.]DAV95580.1 MAG TPA: hypothetical protein [Caudoviricetes sp.]
MRIPVAPDIWVFPLPVTHLVPLKCRIYGHLK